MPTPSPSLTPDAVRAQRRVLTVLGSAQILGGTGLAAGITVGALLTQDMVGSNSLARLPSALFTAGSALAAVAVGRLSQSRGRRPGLAAGYFTGAIGSLVEARLVSVAMATSRLRMDKGLAQASVSARGA
ncbi:hypothetical protein GCM10027262_53620 [Nocardia tengchongensis]